MNQVIHWQSVIEFLNKELAFLPISQSAKRMNLRLQISSAELNLKHLVNKKPSISERSSRSVVRATVLNRATQCTRIKSHESK